MLTPEFKACLARLRDFVEGDCHHDETFNRLAVELLALQYGLNPIYQRLCKGRGVHPRSVSRWTDIPFAPASIFKEFTCSCLESADRTASFNSSGTTIGEPSRHFHNAASLALYEASLWRWFREAFLGRDPGDVRRYRHVLSLTPPPAEAPHSSLVHMFETIRRRAEVEQFVFAGKVERDGAWCVDLEVAMKSLSRVEGPMLLLGTAFSFVHLVDGIAARQCRLTVPPGSLVLETGGYKGRSRELSKPELYRRISARLGIPAHCVISEYGMSELSSQAYDRFAAASGEGDGRTFVFPPWTRVQIISPETGLEVPEGETGLIRILDLANACSVMALQTEDLGVRRASGFELVGRAQAAEPRGCSLQAA